MQIKAHRITTRTKTPFIGVCGNFQFLVTEILRDLHPMIVMRGIVLEGMHFDDRGNYGPGMQCTVGPITKHWRRIQLRPTTPPVIR